MCKFNPKNDSRRIDPCMKPIVDFLSLYLKEGYKPVASCCGHEKYHQTLIVECNGAAMDFCSGVIMRRKKKFYKKDSDGIYFIPEVEESHTRKLTQNDKEVKHGS